MKRGVHLYEVTVKTEDFLDPDTLREFQQHVEDFFELPADVEVDHVDSDYL